MEISLSHRVRREVVGCSIRLEYTLVNVSRNNFFSSGG